MFFIHYIMIQITFYFYIERLHFFGIIYLSTKNVDKFRGGDGLFVGELVNIL